jgi:anti-sigma regulatory factor (Ser/Thr protein kinase)
LKVLFDLRIAPDPAQLRVLRRKARGALAKLGLDGMDEEMVLLVLDELVSNAIEHGASYRREGSTLATRASLDGRDLVIEFEDPDMPPREIADLAAAARCPVADAERGRGLFLVQDALCDLRVEDRSGEGKGLRLVGRYRSRP